MEKKTIKNLLIDFGGVLIDLDRTRCIENFRRLGLEQVDSLLDVYHQQGIFMQQEKGLITPDEFRAGIRSMMNRPEVTDAEIDEAWNSFLVGIPTYKLDLLLKLREHYTVHLLSNTNWIHWQWSRRNAFAYKGHEVEDYFEKIYLSYEMKTAKPEMKMFRAVVSDSGIIPEETLFIDDSEANCLAANTLGIATYTPKAGEDWSHLFSTL